MHKALYCFSLVDTCFHYRNKSEKHLLGYETACSYDKFSWFLHFLKCTSQFIILIN